MSLEVHVDWRGTTTLVGRLHSADQSEAVSFEYDRQWLGGAEGFSIDPITLPLRAGMHHGAKLFGALSDCGPDRWGRMLIERAVRKRVLTSKPFREIDYALALDDASRIGALRFRDKGPFLANHIGKLPPIVRLNALLQATEAIHSDKETAQDLRFLLGEGSPLGGARPKSAIALPDSRLAIAKFPKPDDTRDIAASEVLALSIAAQAGIHVAEHRVVRVGSRSVAVIVRFDRDGEQRIPFISGCTLIGLSTGNAGTYTQLAEGIRQFGDDVPSDLHELWRRMIFSLLASNYDDHLRNHGFLMHRAGRWALSPAYDLNPAPEIERARTPKTAIDEESSDSSIERALSVAGRFGLKPKIAYEILKDVFEAVSQWRTTGRKLGLKKATLDAYSSAFEQPLMEEARRLLK